MAGTWHTRRSAARPAFRRASFDPDSGRAGAPTSVLGGSRFLEQVAVSPDGKWLVFTSVANQSDLVVSRSDGTGERQLTNDAFNDRFPTWSPDGQVIGFFSNRSGNNQIWTIRPDGSQLRQLTFAPDGVASPEWSPDGSRMVYQGMVADQGQLVHIRARQAMDGSDPTTVLESHRTREYVFPQKWSPDGSHILGDANRGIFLFSFASKRFTRLLASGNAQAQAWLNDSRRVLSSDGGHLFRYRYRTNSDSRTHVHSPDTFDGVALSSDNRTIYFTSINEQADIWLATFK